MTKRLSVIFVVFALVIAGVGISPLQASASEMSGDGSKENPFIVKTAEQLTSIGKGKYKLNLHYKLGSDIDLRNVEYSTALIGDMYNQFYGSFDGNGHIIRNLKINGSGNVGLFWGIESTGVVQNLALVDVNVKGGYSSGTLSYANKGTIKNVYVSGKINVLNEKQGVGGLIGFNEENGIVENSFSGVDVTGDSAGGLLGLNTGTVKNSYATGKITGKVRAGGLIGTNYDNTANVEFTYATGKVTLLNGNDPDSSSGGLVGYSYSDTVRNSYWDIETTGQTNGGSPYFDVGKGKSTADMKKKATYVGWDFDNVWGINAGGYPYLRGLPFQDKGNGGNDDNSSGDGGNNDGGDIPNPETPAFSDITNSWAKKEIEYLVEKGILGGYADGTFRPTKPITRGEYASVLSKLLGLTPDPEAAKHFTDVHDWAKGYVGALVKAGITTGKTKTTFGTDDLLSRADMAVFFVRAMGLEDTAKQLNFKPVFDDEQGIPQYAAPHIALATDIGFIKGNADGTYGPKDSSQRQAVARLAYELDVNGDDYKNKIR